MHPQGSSATGARGRAWAPPLDARLRARARDAALLIAGRCTDPERVRAACALAAGQTRYPMTVHWDPVSIAQGDAGLALLCAELARVDPDGGWHDHAERLAHAVLAAVRGRRRVGMGTVGGASGLLVLARRAGGEALRPVVPELQAQVAQEALAVAASVRGRSGMSVAAFDLISGLAGALLGSLPLDDPAVPAVTPFLLRALTALAEDESEPPPWHSPAEQLYDDDQRQQYPHGNLNLGLAHGIPGPLAALALAVRTGTGDQQVAAAVATWGDWVARHATRAAEGPGWPTVVSLTREAGRLREVPSRGLGRDAWCYGTPGVARALYLAGDALDRDDWRALAVEAMAGVYRRPPAERGIDAPTFCHGVAGLLQITLRFHHDTGLALFADAATELTEQVLGAVEPDRPMGVANLEPDGTKVDQPGMLDGAAGVSLVLAGAASEVEPTWDRMFGLS